MGRDVGSIKVEMTADFQMCCRDFAHNGVKGKNVGKGGD